MLKELQYVDANSVVQLKGRVACEINSGDSLLLTEMIVENVFAGLEARDVCAILSAFIFQDKSEFTQDYIIARLKPVVQEAITKTLAIARRVAEV